MFDWYLFFFGSLENSRLSLDINADLMVWEQYDEPRWREFEHLLQKWLQWKSWIFNERYKKIEHFGGILIASWLMNWETSHCFGNNLGEVEYQYFHTPFSFSLFLLEGVEWLIFFVMGSHNEYHNYSLGERWHL